MKYEAVIFDFDGLMVNTEQSTCKLLIDEGKKLGYPMNEEIYKLLIGGNAKLLDEISEKYPFIKELSNHCDETLRWKNFYECYPHPGDCNKPGLENLYRYLKENHYKIAVASSSHRPYLEEILGYLGFPFEYDVLVGSDEVEFAKPNPDVFLKSQRHLNVPLEKCLILEDSRNGILAAKAANIDVVFVEDMIAPDDVMKSIFIHQAPSLNEVIDYLEAHQD